MINPSFALVAFAFATALPACGAALTPAPGAPNLEVKGGRLFVNGQQGAAAAIDEETGVRVLKVMRDDRVIISITESKQAIGQPRRIGFVLETGMTAEAQMDASAEIALSALIRDGVVSLDGTLNEQRFRQYATDRGMAVSNVRDWSKITPLTVISRHPRPIVLHVTSARANGETVESDHAIDAQATRQIHVLVGDRLCIAATTSCVQMEPRLESLVISLDGTAFQ